MAGRTAAPSGRRAIAILMTAAVLSTAVFMTGAGAAPLQLTWSAMRVSPSPPALAYATAAYDTDNNTLVIFGGITAKGALSDDTWVWTGSGWTDYPGSSVTAPPARQRAVMAFDPALHQLILFGGLGARNDGLGDTWAWNGLSWYQEISPFTPSPRYGAALAYDDQGRLLLFGGKTNTAWASGGSSTTTTSTSAPTTTTTTNPGTVTDLADTWFWTSGGWARSSATGPSGRDGAAMALDSTSHQVVLFGGVRGSTLLSDTWVWSHDRWARQAPRTSPPGRAAPTAFDEPAAKALVLFGGATSRSAFSDTWLWNGSNWTPAPVRGAPPARAGAAGAYLTPVGEGLVFGGGGIAGRIMNDAWTLTIGTPSGPPTTRATPPTTARAVGPTTPTTKAKSSPPPTKRKTGRPTPPAVTIPGSRAGQGDATDWLTASPNSVRGGQRVLLTGSGFRPGTSVTITFHSVATTLGQATVASDGTFAAAVIIPVGAHGGTHHFEASGLTPRGQDADLFAAITVLGPRGPAVTAAEKVVLVLVAVLLPVGAWFGMSASSRLRRWRSQKTKA